MTDYKLKEKPPIVAAFEEWDMEHPDEDYRYDEVHEFIASQGRGDILYLL